MTAAEVHLLAAEYYLKERQDDKAKYYYEEAVYQSFGFYQYLRSISNNAESPEPEQVFDSSLKAYLDMEDVSWSAAAGMDEKLTLIAEQKWLHFNVVQSNESWTEIRRLGKIDLDFWVDNTNQQSLPPARWMYVVQPEDKLTNTVFWDVN